MIVSVVCAASASFSDGSSKISLFSRIFLWNGTKIKQHRQCDINGAEISFSCSLWHERLLIFRGFWQRCLTEVCQFANKAFKKCVVFSDTLFCRDMELNMSNVTKDVNIGCRNVDKRFFAARYNLWRRFLFAHTTKTVSYWLIVGMFDCTLSWFISLLLLCMRMLWKLFNRFNSSIK